MNENPRENPDTLPQEQAAERVLPQEEQPADTLAETLAQIQEIQMTDAEGAAPMVGVVEEAARRLEVGVEGVEAAKVEVNFTERATALADKKKDLKDRFKAAVEKALLPVAAAIAMNATPALAQESQTDRSMADSESSMVIKTESHELKKQDVFDLNSPLVVVGEKMKGLKREMSPEELVLIRDFQKKTWQEKNEWVVVSGKDKDGGFRSETKEVGPLGGGATFDILEILKKEQAVMHTHPLEVGELHGVSSQAVRNGGTKPFIMPPSAADVGQCMEDGGTDTIQRIVDPRGVWEYRCDDKHPFAIMRQKMGDEFAADLEMIKTRHSIPEEDITQAGVAVENIHPALSVGALFSELDKKYPGIEEDYQRALTKFLAKHHDFGLAMLSHEGGGEILTRVSVKLSDEELSEQIQGYIRGAEKKGIYMSYTPFKEMPRTKEETKENN